MHEVTAATSSSTLSSVTLHFTSNSEPPPADLSLTFVLTSALSPLQGEGADSGSEPGDGGGATQRARHEQYGPFEHGVAEHLSPAG